MLTGSMVLAYDLTGDKSFLDVASNHLSTYENKLKHSDDAKSGMNDHDVGFVFYPSCVALYKRTGNEEAKQLALRAALHTYNVAYSQRVKFIFVIH